MDLKNQKYYKIINFNYYNYVINNYIIVNDLI